MPEWDEERVDAPQSGDAALPTGDGYREIRLGGSAVHLLGEQQAVGLIVQASKRRDAAPLAVASANLDHIYHFGAGGRWRGVLEHSRATGQLRWITMLDGVPLVRAAERITGEKWPKLSGSDVTPHLLHEAETAGVRVGFLGGLATTHERLREVAAQRWPALVIGGCWAPDRRDLIEQPRARSLAAEVKDADVGMLFVCLGKPRQELWMAEHGAHSGVGSLLAFGAAVDFIAGTVPRAPQRVADAGMEWAWRLAREPRRLARRYLSYGPGAYVSLRMHSDASPLDPSLLTRGS